MSWPSLPPLSPLSGTRSARLAAIVKRTKKGFSAQERTSRRTHSKRGEAYISNNCGTGCLTSRFLYMYIYTFFSSPSRFVLYVPAKMSCKLWLNVWTCRSFTCPFTLRNLDRNPTAALISGFIVPLAQRVCIEKATALRKRCCSPPPPRMFVVYPSVRPHFCCA